MSLVARLSFISLIAALAIPAFAVGSTTQLYVVQTAKGPIFGYEINGYFVPCGGQNASRISLSDQVFKDQKPQAVPGDCASPSPPPKPGPSAG